MWRSVRNLAAQRSRSLYIDWRVAGALAAVTALAFALLTLPMGSAARPFSLQLETQVITWGLWLLLMPLVFAISRRAHAAGLTHWKGITIQVLGAMVVAWVHAVLFGLLRLALTGAGAHNLRASLAGLISFAYAGDLLRYCLLAAGFHALAYQAEARERTLSEAQLSAQLAVARLEALEARIHPHFLFNTLNTITALIRSKPERAIEVVASLADLLRAALRAEPGKEVPLAEELELLRQYIAIQRARFGDRLAVHIDAAEDTLTALVPQLVLQPLVDNAIRHGIAPREARGVITVASRQDGDVLQLSVRDDGVGFGKAPAPATSAASGAGIGLNNTIARLEQLYGPAAALNVDATTPTGTLITITLPYHTALLPPQTSRRP